MTPLLCPPMASHLTTMTPFSLLPTLYHPVSFSTSSLLDPNHTDLLYNAPQTCQIGSSLRVCAFVRCSAWSVVPPDSCTVHSCLSFRFLLKCQGLPWPPYLKLLLFPPPPKLPLWWRGFIFLHFYYLPCHVFWFFVVVNFLFTPTRM